MCGGTTTLIEGVDASIDVQWLGRDKLVAGAAFYHPGGPKGQSRLMRSLLGGEITMYAHFGFKVLLKEIGAFKKSLQKNLSIVIFLFYQKLKF